jgi:hypothetical protein
MSIVYGSITGRIFIAVQHTVWSAAERPPLY